MLRDITIGQYYAADSVIHRLDPRTKLLATLAYLVSLFLFDFPGVYVLAAFFLALVVILSKVP
ncbi:MAG: energy-coupling factor transporter transmembrane protein EcfT, partial [Lachnospiraceae bacterium]|nr:energy-coupling factor transporter transmembrane protein EcfT [Lachnospiraceae bacterium]